MKMKSGSKIKYYSKKNELTTCCPKRWINKRKWDEKQENLTQRQRIGKNKMATKHETSEFLVDFIQIEASKKDIHS